MDDSIFFGKEGAILGACLGIGAILIYKFCLDRFDKPVENLDDRWNFLVPSQLTPHRQYILGFTVYYALSLMIFLILSLAGPEIVTRIATAYPGLQDTSFFSGLKDSSTFPIIVAFVMIGIYPNLRPPPAYDVEIWLRRTGHWIAFIPKNMIRLVEEMQFAEFDLSEDTVTKAWSLIDLKRPILEAPDLKSIGALLDRLVVLYVRAAAPAGDLEADDLAVLRKDIGLDVFRQYRAQLAEVQSTIESVQARLGLEELGRLGGRDRRKTINIAQRDIRKRLDFLYVIFAAAITAKGADRLEDRFRAIGFTSQFYSKQQIPWSPILKVIGLPGIVLFGVLTVSSRILISWVSEDDQFFQYPFPTTDLGIIQQVVAIVVTLGFAIGFALSIRTRLINQDRYFTDKPAAYARIAIKCYWVALLVYLGIYFISFIHSGQPPLEYIWQFAKWAVVPALCGVLVAMSLDRPANSRNERAIAGLKLGAILGIAAWFVFVSNLNATSDINVIVYTWPAQFYTFVVYFGFGFVMGAVLPTTIRAYQEEQNRLPQLVATLYKEVRGHFYDDGQFKEWLHASHPALGGKPPADLLHEDGGTERLIAFVSETRNKVAQN